MQDNLSALIPRDRKLSDDEILEGFLSFVAARKLELYPAQEEAILELLNGKNVILNTPTGSGKSLVATALHFQSMARGRKSVYTSPIKALVNEKFFALCRDFGATNVGLITGDATVNGDAPVICCTAEILANQALREGASTDFADVVMDEFHYYSDRERGVAWQVPLLTMDYARFLIMSATMGELDFFARALTQRTGRETATVQTRDRPVPLEFEYREAPLHKVLEESVDRDRAPVYVVSFTQRECAEEAQNLVSMDLSTKEDKQRIQALLEGVRFDSPYGKDVQRLIRHGIGIHHGGLLPKYRILVERLAQSGLLKVICGTDTLGVGVNIPIRTVLFTKLSKYDGVKTALLSVRDFQQISGRAGRKGFDDRGYVVALAPEHVIENRQIADKIAADPKKAKKLVRKKPPEKGYVGWDENVFRRLIDSAPESLVSRFQVSHAMILQVLSRTQDGCRALAKLIRDSHETAHQKKAHRKRAFQLFRSLVERGIVQLGGQLGGPGSSERVRLNVNLQEDFSLNHAMSLWLVDTLAMLDGQDADYPLNVLSLVEAIVENPELILRKQLDQIKTLRMAEMKAEGMEYEERMEVLEKLEYPKPLREFTYDTFNAFAEKHPWLGQENIRPKSVVREMFERFSSFAEYVRDYDIQRAEGLLLRYISECYRVLVQTVPTIYKTESVMEIETYLGDMLRAVDSSLVEEWEKLRNPGWKALATPPAELAGAAGSEKPVLDRQVDQKIDQKALGIAIRNAVFGFVRALSRGNFDEASAMVEGTTPKQLSESTQEFWAEHSVLATTPAARHPQFTRIDKMGDKADGKTSDRSDPGGAPAWTVTQVLSDAEGATDWVLEFRLDLTRSAEAEKPVLSLLAFEAR